MHTNITLLTLTFSSAGPLDSEWWRGLSPVRHPAQTVRPHSERCTPRTVFFSFLQRSSPQTTWERRPRCHSRPRCRVVCDQNTWAGRRSWEGLGSWHHDALDSCSLTELVCVCVCVCVREREREKDREVDKFTLSKSELEEQF